MPILLCSATKIAIFLFWTLLCLQQLVPAQTRGLTNTWKDGLREVFFSYDVPTVEVHVNLTYVGGRVVEAFVGRGDSIHRDLVPVCETFKTSTSCVEIADTVSLYFYGIQYTPSSLNSKLEDYLGQRTDVINHLIDTYKYQSYLEIGTNTDLNFDIIKSKVSHAVGVDPIQGGTHRMTSNDFFDTNMDYFDVIFIDGLHLAEQVIQDIDNALSWLNPGGTIVMHDCNPRQEDFAAVPVKSNGTAWTGDVYKAAVAMRLRQDIEIIVVDIDYGVGIIRRRDNSHPLPEGVIRHLDGDPLQTLEYDYFDRNRRTLLRLMSLQDARDWLVAETMEEK